MRFPMLSIGGRDGGWIVILIIRGMVSVKVTYNAKPKRTETLVVESFADLVAQIYKVFNVEEGKINFMKPRLKVAAPPLRTRTPSRRTSRRAEKSSSWARCGRRRLRSSWSGSGCRRSSCSGCVRS